MYTILTILRDLDTTFLFWHGVGWSLKPRLVAGARALWYRTCKLQKFAVDPPIWCSSKGGNDYIRAPPLSPPPPQRQLLAEIKSLTIHNQLKEQLICELLKTEGSAVQRTQWVCPGDNAEK